MYAYINKPGSRHFRAYGPATARECNDWIERTRAKMLETELLSSTMPYGVVSNKQAKKWKYLDGSPVFDEVRLLMENQYD